MPHDIDGNELKPGDRVLVECEVRAVHSAPDYCNVELDTSVPMPPYTTPTRVTLNTKQVCLMAPAPAKESA